MGFDHPTCEGSKERLRRCDAELSELVKPHLVRRDPVPREVVELNTLIAEDQQNYNACLQQADKRDECLQLQGQLKSVTAACDEIKGRLQAAPGGRPAPETYGGTLHTFIVRCNATEVKAGDIVFCTANGIYSSNLNTELDLTRDPDTQWQNGPRVSTTNLLPGQTFRVTATRSGFTEGVTITVVAGQQEQNIPQSAGGVKMYRSGGSTQEAGKQSTYQSGGSTQEVGKQATYQARVDDPRATHQTLYAYYWFLNGQNKTRGYNQTTFSFAIPQKGTNTVMVRVMKTSDRGKTWQKVGEATDSFVAQGKPAGSNIPPVAGDIRPFVGTWKQPYHGGESTLTFNASGSGTINALGTELTNGQPNKEVGTISRCVVEGQTLKCYWASTYSDGDKSITRGGALACTISGDTLTASSTVDRATLKEKWNIPPDSYTPGARSGGTSTYTRAK
jgi:hypothetical protein